MIAVLTLKALAVLDFIVTRKTCYISWAEKPSDLWSCWTSTNDGVHCHSDRSASHPHDASVTLHVTQTVVSVIVTLVLPAACSVFVPSALRAMMPPGSIGNSSMMTSCLDAPSSYPERMGLTPISVHTAPRTLPSGVST
jgi:hypothetical protein